MSTRSQVLEAIEQGLSRADFVASLPLDVCAGCGERVTLQRGDRDDEAMASRCDPCRWKEIERRLGALPKSKALLRAGVPEEYRRTEAWLADPWACDTTWPEWAPAREWPASGAWSITLAGRNGSGKSMMAGELLWSHWGMGARPVKVRSDGDELPLSMWVRETALVREDENAGYGDPRHLAMACRKSRVLVWDELGAGWSTARARTLCSDLIEERHGKHFPTIFTTQRPLSAEKAEKLGIAPEKSVEFLASEIYSRLRSGWMGRWMKLTWRGSGDEVPA